MKPRRCWLMQLMILVLLIPGCGLHGKPSVDRSKALAGAHTAQPELTSDTAAPSRIVAPGVVEPWGGNIELSPHESGRISQILVREGERVKAGQKLATLDDETERAAVSVARADAAEAEAVLQRTRRGATQEELRQARAEAEASRARALFAKREAQRFVLLGSEAAVATVEVERTSAEAKASAAAARAKEATLAAVVRGARSEDRKVAESRVLAARARLELAEANLARREVMAPTSGAVLLSRSHVGEFFNVGQSALFVLGDTSKLQVRLEVDEIDALRVKVGAKCRLYGDDNVPIINARVVRIAPRMGRRALPTEAPTTRADVRVREVFAEVPNTAALVPGRRVWGHIEPHR